MTYLINLLTVPIYYFFLRVYMGSRQKAYSLFIWIVAIHAILFRALSNPLNTPDGKSYDDAFKDLANWTFSETVLTVNYYTEWGPAFLCWNWLVSRLSPTSDLFFILTSIVSVGGVMWFYKKTSYALLLTVFIYLLYPMTYLPAFYVLRQHLAVVFVMLALYYYDNTKKFLAFSLIAALMHTSGIIMFPFYFWKRISLKSYMSPRIILYILLGSVAFRLSVGFVMSIFSRYQAIYAGAEANNNIVPIILIGSLVVLYGVTGLFNKIQCRIDKMIVGFIVYGLVLSLVSFRLPGAGRLTLYHMYIYPVAIALLYKYNQNKILNNLYLCFMMVITVIMVYLSTDVRSYEYLFLWEDVVNR